MGNCYAVVDEVETLENAQTNDHKLEQSFPQIQLLTAESRQERNMPSFQSLYLVSELLQLDELGPCFQVLNKSSGRLYKMLQYNFKLGKQALNLKHQNLVKIVDCFQSQCGTKLIVQNGNINLAAYCSSMSVLTEADAAKIIYGLLQAVRYLHDKGIVHSRISINNVFVNQNTHEVQLADYWLYQYSAETCQGSQPFSSPEKLQGGFNEKCDIWACGVILHLLLSGKFPSQADDVSLRIKSLNSANALIFEMLLSSPKNRISARKVLKHPWFLEALGRRLSNSTLRDLRRSIQAFNFRAKLRRLLSKQLGIHKKRNDIVKLLSSGDIQGALNRHKSQLLQNNYDTAECTKQKHQTSILKGRDEDMDDLLEELLQPQPITRARLHELFNKLDKKGLGKLSRRSLTSLTKGENNVWEELLNGLGSEIRRSSFIERVQEYLAESSF